MALETGEKVRLVELFYENGRSPMATIRAYRNEYGVQDVCSESTVRKLIKKFQETGSVLVAKKSGRPPIPEDQIAEIFLAKQDIAAQNYYGEASTSKIAEITNIPKSTVWKALRKNLKLTPYRPQTVHELKDADPARRLQFARRFLAEDLLNPASKYRILYTDEANFTLSGQVNTWNTRIWAAENPHTIIEEPLHSEKVTVWIGFTAEFMLGPYFFQELDANGGLRSVTVNGERYREMLDEFVIPALDEMGELQETTFQQDGAPAHCTRAVLDLLNEEFEGRVISRNCEYPWPARSPDLTPMDFWLWPVLKSRVYKDGPPRTMLELRNRIANAAALITRAERIAAIDGIVHRLNLVEQQQGGHIEQLP